MKTDFITLFCMFVLIASCVYADYDPNPVEYADDPKIISRDVKCQESLIGSRRAFKNVKNYQADASNVGSEFELELCKATIMEMQNAIKLVDPRKRVEVSGFHMNQVAKSVQLIRSETYLTELMETICKKMDDYAKARVKETRKLTVLKMILDDGTMNPDMSIVDFVHDGDLNKSLEHFCLEVLEDHEETFLRVFMDEEQPSNIPRIICTEQAQYCDAPAENHVEL